MTEGGSSCARIHALIPRSTADQVITQASVQRNAVPRVTERIFLQGRTLDKTDTRSGPAPNHVLRFELMLQRKGACSPMDATRARTGFPAAGTHTTADQAAESTGTPVRGLTEHATGLAPERGITSVNGGEPRTSTRVSTRPVQVLPIGTTQEPGATTASGVGGTSAEEAGISSEISEIVAAVQSAASEAASLKEAAERANKTAAAFLKEAQDWVSKAIAHATRGRADDADAAMAKAQEAWGKASAQQAVADQAASGARAASERAQAALENAQGALAALQSQGLARSALAPTMTLVDQAARLTTSAGRAATAADVAVTNLGKALSNSADPREVADVIKLIASAQAEVVGAQSEASSGASAQRAASGAAKNANSKLPVVSNALGSGGTAGADPVVAQITGFRDTAAARAGEARQHSAEAKRLAASGAAKAAAAFDAARQLAAQFAALGKNSSVLSSLTKAAQQAKDAAAKAQRSATIADNAATTAEAASRQAQASLDDAQGRVRRYLDDLEAANAPRYDSSGY